MHLRTKLCLALSIASAIAFAVSCGNFSGTENGGNATSDGSAGGDEGGVGSDGSVQGVEGGQSMPDAAPIGAEGGAADAGVDAAPNCDTFVCDGAGNPIADASCPVDTPTVVYEHVANCSPAALADCEYCYSNSATASAGSCTGFSDTAVARFSIYSTPSPGLLELDRCGNSVANHNLQLGGNCTVGANGAMHLEGKLGYIVPGKSCGNKDLTEMLPIATKYYAYNDAGILYAKTGVVYWALPPP